MTDYATRRNIEVQGTLNRIDIASTPLCRTCGHHLRPNGPSDLFCNERCQDNGLASQGLGQVPPRWRAPDAENPLLATMEEDRRRNLGMTVRQALEFERVWLNQPTPATPDIRFSFEVGESWETVANRVHSWATNIPDGLSEISATVRSMDAVADNIEATTDRMAAKRAEIDHRFHRHEQRGGALLWIASALLLLLGVGFAVNDIWLAAAFMWSVTAGSSWLAWMSVGNARAAAAACPICHPPCDTTE